MGGQATCRVLILAHYLIGPHAGATGNARGIRTLVLRRERATTLPLVHSVIIILVGDKGLEPLTGRLKAAYSTTELIPYNIKSSADAFLWLQRSLNLYRHKLTLHHGTFGLFQRLPNNRTFCVVIPLIRIS